MTIYGLDDPVFLVELYPFSPAAGAVTPYYFSTRPFITAPGDSPANQVYDAVVTVAFQRANHLFAPGKISGASDASRGAIQIMNGADRGDGATAYGRYDAFRRLIWTGRRARVLAGQNGAAYASFIPVFDGIVTGRPQLELDHITVPISDWLDRLNTKLQPSLYAGTGNAEGDQTLAGKAKPKGFGICREVPAPLVYAPLNIYQVHDGAFTALLNAYEGGGVISAGPYTDYPNYAALAAASVPIGTVATCLAGGYVRLGSTPSHVVTFDVQFTTLTSVARCAEALLTGCYGMVTGVDYDATSIAALDALQPAVAGYWADLTPTTGLTALDFLLGGAGCWYGTARVGLIRVGRIDPPTITGPTDPNCALAITQYDVLAGGATLAVPLDPPSSVTVNYGKFYQAQSSGYVTSLGASRIADLAQQWRTATAPNPLAYLYAQAQVITPDSPFDARADAQVEAARLLTANAPALGLPRDVFTVTTFLDPLSIDLGRQVWFSHNRYDAAGGQGFVVIGMVEDAASSTVTLTLWG